MNRIATAWSRLALLVLCSAAPLPALAIFQNGGFETNAYTAWTLGGGTNPGLAGAPPFNSASVQITPGAAGPASIVGPGSTDPLAPTIQLPRVGQFTAKLNDEGGGALVTTLRQTDTVSQADIDPADGLPHIRFAFAPVLDDPNHSPAEQPYFYVVVKNLADNSVLFEQFAYSGQANVQFLQGAGSWKYLEFQNVDAVLPASALGQQVELTVIASDCSLGGHGGYVYVDGFGSAQVPPDNSGGPQGAPHAVPALGPAGLGLLGVLLALTALSMRRWHA
ncbi:hypothetical protein [Dokdonella sp.]|uniref:hypothetical protein n=1 Tax=Dokdonella sp. TaxID=2291710 RepID=UPI0025BCAA7F|nr:hypothetical protein [Dokdonella sp.]MBX3689119.1 hypothetical protein [Dokdonella sp.]